ncbi:MAG: MFS transporter [Actinomycetota bacterium]|nr:MFS transporter [Actinomycetota bacterium]
MTEGPAPDAEPAAAAGTDRPGLRGAVARLAIDVTPLRTSPAFRRLWIGQAVAFVGWRMTVVAVPVQVYELTGSSLAVGLVALTQFVPLVSLTIIGGAIADAVDRRRLLVVSSIGILIALAGLLVNAALADPRVWAVFLFSFLSWSFFSLGAGAMRSLTPRLVPTEQITAAAALSGLYGNLGSVVGPAIAGVLIEATGLGWTYAIALAAGGVAVWSVVTLPPIAPLGEAAQLTARALLDGFRYLGAQRVVLAFFLIDTIAMVFGMPNALFPELADRLFGDPSVAGYLFAAPAAGAVVATLVSGWAGHIRRQGVAIVVAASAWGGAIALFGFARTLWLALLLLAVAGAADQISAIFRSAIVLTVTPDHLRGRVSGIEFAQVASAPSLGNLEAGVVASLTSVRFSIVSGGIACVVGTIVVALVFPVLLRYDAKEHR